MVLMRTAWVLAMLTVTVLALLPVEHLQLPVFNWWDKAQHTLAFFCSDRLGFVAVADVSAARFAGHAGLWGGP